MSDILNHIPMSPSLEAMDLDRAAWLAARRTGIGGSEIAAILGLSPWVTPLAVWRRKMGLDPDTPPSWPMRIGARMEDTIADAYAEREGVQLVPVPFLRDRQHPHRIASLDRILIPRDGSATKIAEIKWSAAAWDAIPDQYYLQVQWYMAVTGLSEAVLIVATPRQEPIGWPVAADPSLGALLLEECDRWWRDHVVAGVPPEPQSVEERRAYWLGRLPQDERAIEASPEIEAIARDLLAAKVAVEAAVERAREIETSLVAAMAAAGASRVTGNGWRAAVVERQGSIAYSRAVKALGISAEALEPFRGEASRYLRLTADKQEA